MVEDKTGVTNRNMWGLGVVWVYALVIMFVSSLLFFSGGGDLEDFGGLVYYIAVLGFSLGGITFLMTKLKFSVYLLEPRMGWGVLGTNKIIASPLLKLFFGVVVFSGVALLVSFLGKFAGSIPRFAVIGAVEIFLSFEPTVLAETLLIVVIPLTVARRFIIGVTGEQNIFFFAIMLLVVCSSMFFVGYSYHGLVYGDDEGNRILTGVLFWIISVLTVLFGDIIFGYVFHAMMNIFNSAQEVFTSDFYKFFLLTGWAFFVILTIGGVFVYVNVVTSREEKKPVVSLS